MQEPMKYIRVHRSNPTAALIGAGGFACGLAVAGGLYGALSRQLPDFAMSLLGGALALALAGAIGGAALGRAWAPPSWVARGAAAASVGLGTGFVATSLLFSFLLPIEGLGDLGILLVYVSRFALIGAWLGAALAACRGNWRGLPLLALAGAVGFGLGAVLLDRAGQLLAQPVARLVPGFVGETLHDSIALAITWGISFAAAGTIGGGVLGYVLGRERAGSSAPQPGSMLTPSSQEAS